MVVLNYDSIPVLLFSVLCGISCMSCIEQQEDRIAFVSGDKKLEKSFSEAAKTAMESSGGGRFFSCSDSSDFSRTACRLPEIFENDSVADPDYSGAALNYVIEKIIGYKAGPDCNSFSVLPSVSDTVGYIGVRSLPVGRNKVDIIHEDSHSTVISNTAGPADIRCDVCFDGDYPYISIGETIFMASHDVLDGKRICKVNVSIPPGGSVRLRALPE